LQRFVDRVWIADLQLHSISLHLTTPSPRWTGRVPALVDEKGESHERPARRLGLRRSYARFPDARALDRELSLEGSDFDDLAERQLL